VERGRLELKTYLPALVALTLAYWAAAMVGLQWSVVPGAGTAVWPAAGIALAGLLLGGVRLWPAIVIGRLLASLALGSPLPVWSVLLIAAGTALGAVIPALILRRFRLLDPALAQMRDIFWLTLVGSSVGAVISASVGATAVWLSGAPPERLPALWLNWWFGFASGVLVITPLILVWVPRQLRGMSSRRWMHLLACLGTIAAVSALLFLMPTSPFLRVWHIYPAFIWAAVAFQVRGVSAGLVITSIFAIWGSAHGSGPLIFEELPPVGQVLLAQQFIAVTALTNLFLAAAIDERRNVEARARLSAIVSSSPDAMVSIGSDGRIGSWNGGAQRLFGYTPEEAIGQSFSLIVPPDAPEEHQAIFPKALAGEVIDVETVRIGKNGTPVDVAMSASQMRGPDGTVLGVAAVARDISQRKRTERELHETRDRQRLLINELNHRVKNSLAIVQAIAQQSFKGVHSSPEARAAFEGRLAALSAAHDLLTRENWETASMQKVIADAVAPYRGQSERFEIDGPDLRLPPKTAVSLALALHELATNAVKYGALSTNEGRVEIKWKVERQDGLEQLRLVWREHGGPPVTVPEKRGFGTRLIERSLAAEFEGKVRIDFDPQGVVCTVLAPLPQEIIEKGAPV
jgi:PAS domain S-box-containing protein